MSARRALARARQPLPLTALLLALLTALVAGCDGSSTAPETTSKQDDDPPPPPPTYALAVTFEGDGSGRVTSSPAGLDCASGGGSCAATFEEGMSVQLTASPDEGSTLEGWGGACSGTGGCSLTVTAATAVSATFDDPDTNTVPTGASGGTVTSPDGRVTLDIPEGALSSDVEISVRESSFGELEPSVQALFDVDDPPTVYEFGPSGLEFEEPAVITFEGVDGEAYTEGEEVSVAGGALYVVNGENIEPLDNVEIIPDAETGTVTIRGEVEHFSILVHEEIAFRIGVAHTPSGFVGEELRVEMGVRVRRSLAAVTLASVEAFFASESPVQDGEGAEWESYEEAKHFLGRSLHRCVAVGPGEIRLRISVTLDQEGVGPSNPIGTDFDLPVTCDPLPPVEVTVELTGDGSGTVTSDPAGISCPDDCDGLFEQGVEVTLTATPAGEHMAFCGWDVDGDASADPTLSFTPEDDTDVTACFQEDYGGTGVRLDPRKMGGGKEGDLPKGNHYIPMVDKEGASVGLLPTHWSEGGGLRHDPDRFVLESGSWFEILMYNTLPAGFPHYRSVVVRICPLPEKGGSIVAERWDGDGHRVHVLELSLAEGCVEIQGEYYVNVTNAGGSQLGFSVDLVDPGG